MSNSIKDKLSINKNTNKNKNINTSTSVYSDSPLHTPPKTESFLFLLNVFIIFLFGGD